MNIQQSFQLYRMPFNLAGQHFMSRWYITGFSRRRPGFGSWYDRGHFRGVILSSDYYKASVCLVTSNPLGFIACDTCLRHRCRTRRQYNVSVGHLSGNAVMQHFEVSIRVELSQGGKFCLQHTHMEASTICFHCLPLIRSKLPELLMNRKTTNTLF